jgi:6-pyruvoyltetrahydropterin/6-carboxytetrahydropterin synthase
VFPSGDCRLLPVANTTSELLAAYIGERLLSSLGGAAAKIERLRVEVDECDGQIGIWRWQVDSRS